MCRIESSTTKNIFPSGDWSKEKLGNLIDGPISYFSKSLWLMVKIDWGLNRESSTAYEVMSRRAPYWISQTPGLSGALTSDPSGKFRPQYSTHSRQNRSLPEM